MRLNRLNLMMIMALATVMIFSGTIKAKSAFVGVAHITVGGDNYNASLPEITVKESTPRLYATKEEAAAAAEKLMESARSKAVSEAVSIWGNVSADQVKIIEKASYTKKALDVNAREDLYFRGIVAQGFIFEIEGEKEIVFYSRVTDAFETYDEAYQGAKSLAKNCKEQAVADIISKYEIAEEDIMMASVNFDVELTNRIDSEFVPVFRGMVVHGFIFEIEGVSNFEQKVGITEAFDNYNDAWHGARAMSENNFKNGRQEIMDQYGLSEEDVILAKVVVDVELM